MKKLVLLLAIVMAVAVTACGTLDIQPDVELLETADGGEKTPVVLGQDVTADAEGEGVSEPVEPTGDAAGPSVLPAPLYYLSTADGQVWRVEQDGATTTQVTASEVEVKEFSVSPTGTHVAYIAGNDLYLMGAPGEQPEVLVDGADVRAPEDMDMPYIAFEQLDHLRFSPDGSKLAYGLGGVNIYQLSTGSTRLALANDPIPGPDDTVEAPPRMYMPERWSPDGSRMVVSSGIYFSEGGRSQILDLASGALTDLDIEGGIACCQWAWSQDGGDVFVANDSPGMISTGLWRADVQNGQYTTLVNGLRGDTLTVFGAPYDPANGQVYGFMATGPFEELMSTGLASVTMSAVPQDGADDGQALRADSYVQGEAAWAPDGSGAAVVDIAGRESEWPRVGTLRWLPVNGGAVELPAEGYMLDWGAAGS